MVRSSGYKVLLSAVLVLAMGQGLLSCMSSQPVGRNGNYEALVRKITLPAKKYEKMRSTEVLMDLVQRGNDQLQSCGELPFGLVIVGREAEIVDDFDVREGSFYEALEQVSSAMDCHLEIREMIRIGELQPRWVSKKSLTRLGKT